MKKLFLMIIPALICGLMFISCSAEKTDEETPKLPSSSLYVIGTKAGDNPNITDLVFTGNDIVSFDVDAGYGVIELFFSKEKTDEIISRAKLYCELHFFIDGQPIFSPPIKVHFAYDHRSLLGVLDLQFLIWDNDRISVMDATTLLISILWDSEEAALAFALRMQKRREQLDVLRNYLSDRKK